tara:strand:+ start:44 stop:985 length:942 start_codon:yes stop_codon:yes gene_type:complete
MSCSAFVAFPGQGSQYPNMLSDGGILDLALSNDHLESVQCCSELISHDVVQLIEDKPENLLNQTSITQPILLLCSYLHYQNLLDRTNISPYALAGHSLGEYTALVAANSLSITSALQLVRKRGVLMENTPNGSMAAILGLDIEIIEDVCIKASINSDSTVQCANLNSVNQTVISGHKDAVNKAQELCLEKGAKRVRKLNVSIAAHSSLMKAAAEELLVSLNNSDITMPAIPIIHNVNADHANDLDELKSLLVSQLYSPVQWVSTCKKISENKSPIIECGPSKVLAGIFKSNKLKNLFSTSDKLFYEKILNYGE